MLKDAIDAFAEEVTGDPRSADTRRALSTSSTYLWAPRQRTMKRPSFPGAALARKSPGPSRGWLSAQSPRSQVVAWPGHTPAGSWPKASADRTSKALGWTPAGPTLLEDIRAGYYFR